MDHLRLSAYCACAEPAVGLSTFTIKSDRPKIEFFIGWCPIGDEIVATKTSFWAILANSLLRMRKIGQI